MQVTRSIFASRALLPRARMRASSGSSPLRRATARPSRGSPTATPPPSFRSLGRRRPRVGLRRATPCDVAVLVVATPCPLILAAPIAIFGPLPRCTCRHDRQGSRRARAPRRGAHPPPGQDRHPHGRLPRGRACGRYRMTPAGRDTPTRRLARSDVGACPRREPRRRREGARIVAQRPDWRDEDPAEASPAPSTGTGRRRILAAGSTATATSVPTPRISLRRCRRRGGPRPGARRRRREAEAAIVMETGCARRSTLAADLRQAGIAHVALCTGDRVEVARRGGKAVGIDEVYADQRPEEKLAVVRRVERDARSPERRHGRRRHQRRACPRARRCGGGHGGQRSDHLLGDRRCRDHRRRCEPDRALDRDRSPIALRSPGRASSPASGFHRSHDRRRVRLPPPVWARSLQEVIDVAVILNALRALRG